MIFREILDKIDNGTFVRGNNCYITHYSSEGDIYNYAYEESTLQVLTEKLWKLARVSIFYVGILNQIPEEFKDEELYKEMCRSNFHYGMKLTGDKQNVMDYIPQEKLTPHFLLELLAESHNNFARFNEHALETEFEHETDGKIVKEKMW